MQDAAQKGRMNGPGEKTAGENNGRAVLSQAQVTRIRKLAAAGAKHRALGRQFNVGKSTISRIVNGETWKSLPEVKEKLEQQP